MYSKLISEVFEFVLTAKCKCYEGADATGAADEKRLRDRAPANQQHAACSFHLMVQLTNVGSVGWHRIELGLICTLDRTD